MTQSVRLIYSGAAPRHASTVPGVASPELWRPGQSGYVSAADAALLLQSGEWDRLDDPSDDVDRVVVSADQLAAMSVGRVGVLYVLSDPPHGWYRWDGAAFVQVGAGQAPGGGLTQAQADQLYAPTSHVHPELMTAAERAKLAGLPDAAALAGSLSGKVDAALLGAASGVAELDSTGKLKASQVPALAMVDVSATGLTLNAGVLTLTQDDGGPDVTLDMTSFATDAELAAGLAGRATSAQGAKADAALQPGALPAGTTVTAAQIYDASAAGRALVTAPDEQTQRTALGLGPLAVMTLPEAQASVSGAIPSRTGKPGSMRLVVTGYDSLTDGAAGSTFRTYFDAVARAHAGYGGPGLMMLRSRAGFSKTNDLQYLTLPATGDGVYSLNGEGLTVTGATGGSYFTQSSLGADWTTCKVFYRRKPTGGTFRARTADMSGGTGAVVNTAGAAGLGSVVINAGGRTANGRTVVGGEITGDVTVYALLFVNGATGYLPGNIAIGGSKMSDHAALDAAARAEWITALQPTHWLINGGMNDRHDVTPAQHAQHLTTVATAIRGAAPDCKIVIVQSNDPSDAATTNFAGYTAQKIDVARSLGCAYWDERTLLGDYSTAVARGYMADAVHPDDDANRVRAGGILSAVGLPSDGADPGIPSPVSAQAYVGALTTKQFVQTVANTPVLLYSLGMTNGYPGAYIEVSVTCQRFGSGAGQRKTLRALLNGGTTSGNTDAINTPTVAVDYTAGAPGTLNLTAAIEGGRCNVYGVLVEYAGYGAVTGKWEAGYAGAGGNIVVEY